MWDIRLCFIYSGIYIQCLFIIIISIIIIICYPHTGIDNYIAEKDHISMA